MIKRPNHLPECTGNSWHHSGRGYNRVRVCDWPGCQAEDHDPDTDLLPRLLHGMVHDEPTESEP